MENHFINKKVQLHFGVMSYSIFGVIISITPFWSGF